MNVKGLFINEQRTFDFPEMGTIRGGLDNIASMINAIGKPSRIKTRIVSENEGASLLISA